MDWHELPSSVRGVVLGVGLALFIGWLTQAAGPALVALYVCTALGLLIDGVRLSWRLYWSLTLECSWCRTRINRYFARNKLLTRELHGQEHWYCSPRCYTEWHRRHYQDRKQLNLLNEGNPLITISKSGE